MTHGGIQEPSRVHGPPWQLETAYLMKQEGFDSAIHYNGCSRAAHPARRSSNRRGCRGSSLAPADRFPAGDPGGLEFIGHSEGTVINTYAITKLSDPRTPELKSGFIEDTLLDPHAANNDIVSGQAVSFAGPLAGMAESSCPTTRPRPTTPPAYFPSVVHEAQVFYEHTAATASGSSSGAGPRQERRPPGALLRPDAHAATTRAIPEYPSGTGTSSYPPWATRPRWSKISQLNGRIDGPQIPRRRP